MDYYAILEVPRGASQEEIKRAFRRAASLYHPDKLGIDASVSEKIFWTKRFQNINEAYGCLSNPTTRAQYDHTHPEDSVADPPKNKGLNLPPWFPYIVEILENLNEGNLEQYLRKLRNSNLPITLDWDDYLFIMIVGYSFLKKWSSGLFFAREISQQHFKHNSEILCNILSKACSPIAEIMIDGFKKMPEIYQQGIKCSIRIDGNMHYTATEWHSFLKHSNTHKQNTTQRQTHYKQDDCVHAKFYNEDIEDFEENDSYDSTRAETTDYSERKTYGSVRASSSSDDFANGCLVLVGWIFLIIIIGGIIWGIVTFGFTGFLSIVFGGILLLFLMAQNR